VNVQDSHDPSSPRPVKPTKPQPDQDFIPPKSSFTSKQVDQHTSGDSVSKVARNNEMAGPRKQPGEVSSASRKALTITRKALPPRLILPARIERDELAIAKALKARGKLSFEQRESLDQRFCSAVHVGDDARHIRDLVDRGADVNSKFKDGPSSDELISVLGREILHHRRPDVLTFLFERGVDPNSTTGYYGPVLSFAAYKGRTDIVRLLLAQDADLNVVGEVYKSPLQAVEACWHNAARLDITELLKVYGAV